MTNDRFSRLGMPALQDESLKGPHVAPAILAGSPTRRPRQSTTRQPPSVDAVDGPRRPRSCPPRPASTRQLGEISLQIRQEGITAHDAFRIGAQFAAGPHRLVGRADA